MKRTEAPGMQNYREKHRWQPTMKDVTMETEKIMNIMVGINTNAIEFCQ